MSLKTKIEGYGISENEFLGQVLQLAKLYKWQAAHFRAARTEKGWRTPVQGDAKGFPDLLLTREGDLLFAELKSEKGKVSPEQQQWIDALKKTGHPAEIWRPSDWVRICAILGDLRLA